MNKERSLQAKKDFSPERMLKHLKRASDGTVYFDRSKLVTDRESSVRFYYILNRFYVSGWRDIENLTVYFESVGDEIVAGGYNLTAGKKTSRRRLISTNKQSPRTPYTYTLEGIGRIKSIIESA